MKGKKSEHMDMYHDMVGIVSIYHNMILHLRYSSLCEIQGKRCLKRLGTYHKEYIQLYTYLDYCYICHYHCIKILGPLKFAFKCILAKESLPWQAP